MQHFFKVLSITIILAALLTGCSSKSVSLTAQSINPKTGEMEEVKYSRVLDGKAIIVPETLGLYMLMELDEKKVSGLYGLKQSMGALGPDDIGAKAGLTFFLYNMTDRTIELDLNTIRTPNQSIRDESVHLTVPAREAIEHPVGRLSTSWYRTDMQIEFNFTYTGKTGGGTLTLQRRTTDEIAEINKKLAAAQTK